MAQATSSPATQGWISGARGQEVGLGPLLPTLGHVRLVGVGMKGLAFQTFMAGPASPSHTETLLEGGQHPLLNRRPSWHSQWPAHIAHLQMAAGPGSSAVDVRAGLLRPRDVPRPMLFTQEFYIPLL